VVTLDASSTPAGVVGYEVSLYDNGAFVSTQPATIGGGKATATWTQQSFTAQSTYTVRARGIGTTASAVTGPPSAPCTLITSPPAELRASFDGRTVIATWNAVPGAVIGYAVSVASTGLSPVTVASGTTNATSIALAATLQLGTSYAVSVSAVGGLASGPSSTADPLTHATGFFFPPVSTSSYAYIFRGDIRAPGAADIALFLPQLFVAANPTLPPPQPPFTLAKSPNGTDPNYPYVLTIAKNDPTVNVWSFTGNGIRPALQTAYLAFLTGLEAVAGGLVPGALALVQQVIAQGLPFSFAETLYYAYGFDPTNGVVNVQPGMRVRVDFESFQLVNPGSSPSVLSGYGGSGSAYFDVGSLPANATAFPSVFDAFLAQMTIPVVAPNTGGSGGAIDFQGPNYQLPYIRVFYPPTFPSSDAGGSTSLAQNVVILWANTFTTLANATTRFLTYRNFQGITGVQYAFFRGRTAVIPEIACTVNGVETWVPIGTTVRQLLARLTALPPNLAARLAHFVYARAIGNVVDTASTVAPTYALARRNTVHYGFATLDQYAYTGLSCFDLPVLLGDELTFEE
jgi:hypothetical protein